MQRFGALVLGLTFSVCVNAQAPVPLGSTSNFAVLAGSTVTNTGNTIVTGGDVGLSPGTAVVGFPPGIITGGVIHAADGTAGTAQVDLTTAYVDAAGRPDDAILLADIGGSTFLPGVYQTGGTPSLGITGTVTLDGNGDPNAVFIFQIASTLTTAAGNSVVNLIGGAQAANVFWQVGSSATLGTTTVFNGTILAQDSITLTTGAVLNGRALARTGAVTLDSNAVTNPGPAGQPPPALSLACPFPSGQVGQPYASALVATGGLAPYAYSISTGSLPAGLTLNPTTGQITGTPSAQGTSNYTARVDDANDDFATASCALTVLFAAPPAIPEPSSFILFLTAMLFIALYRSRDALLNLFKRGG